MGKKKGGATMKLWLQRRLEKVSRSGGKTLDRLIRLGRRIQFRRLCEIGCRKSISL